MSFYTKSQKKLWQERADEWIAKIKREEDDNEVICDYFGCGKKLSLVEKLAGNVCKKHMNQKQFIFTNGNL